MAEISVDVACGNSPRKGFLRDFYVAFAESDDEPLLAGLADDVRWTVVGDEPVVGPDAAVELLARRVDGATAVSIDSLITHGDEAAANGTVSVEDGVVLAFCDVFAFDGYSGDAAIESVQSYVVETE